LKNYEILFFSNNIQEIKDAINYLTNEVEIIFDQQIKSNDLVSFKEAFIGWYEEMIQHYNKIYHVCNTNDHHNALYAAVELDFSLANNFSKIGILSDLPNMIEVYVPNDLKNDNCRSRTSKSI